MGTIINANEKFGNIEYAEKCKEYNEYIVAHKSAVIQAYRDLFVDRKFKIPSTLYGEQLTDIEFDDTVVFINNDIMTHDDSKFDTAEFAAYRRKFYPTRDELNVSHEDQLIADEEFAKAWKHPFLNNYHHPAYWKWVDFGRDTGNMSRLEFSRAHVIPTMNTLGQSINVPGSLRIRETPLREATRMPLFAIIHMICDWHSFHYIKGSDTLQWFKENAKDERSDMGFATVNFVEELMDYIFA